MSNKTVTDENTALNVTEAKLIDWSACSSGKNWFLEKFPQGGMFGEVYQALRDDRRYSDGDWLVEKVFSQLDAKAKTEQLVSIAGADKAKIERQAEECCGKEGDFATTGYRANAATTGEWANAATTGEWANAATTGNLANAATTGNLANAATTGYRANAATTGYRANAATTGNLANAATTGEWANAATTGYLANAATTGEWANAATTGYRANAATTGNLANAATTGNLANAATTGEHAVSAALGYNSKAKAGIGGAIVLCHRNDDGELIHIRCSKVGENEIKPDVWYSLNAAGEFEEVEP